MVTIMDKNTVTRAIIKVAAEKGMKNMSENPDRAIRYLVDLAGSFSNSEFQKSFFDAAIEELQNKESMYFKLVKRITEETNPSSIVTFGINLGYNCWTMGAGMIKKYVESKGFYVPWYLAFSLGKDCKLRVFDINALIEQGKKMGIYSYVFIIGSDYSDFDLLVAALKKQKECACMLMADPEMITQQRAEHIFGAQNVMLLLNMENTSEFFAVADRLQQLGCFYGGFSGYGRVKKIDPSELLRSGEQARCATVFFLRNMEDMHDGIFQDSLGINDNRENITAASFPVDLYQDFALIDNNVSGHACMAMIMNDGSVVTADMGKIDAQESCSSLENVFKKAFPISSKL